MVGGWVGRWVGGLVGGRGGIHPKPESRYAPRPTPPCLGAVTSFSRLKAEPALLRHTIRRHNPDVDLFVGFGICCKLLCQLLASHLYSKRIEGFFCLRSPQSDESAMVICELKTKEQLDSNGVCWVPCWNHCQ